MPAAVGMLEEFEEVEQAWQIWSTENPTSSTNIMETIWVAAASRLLARGAGRPLQRLALLINIYNELKSDELVILVDQAIADVDEAIEDVSFATIDAETLMKWRIC
jgi:hypothetical protein